jgi:hypothetical protein
MEEDDEFGDLYTDILIPTQPPTSTSALSNPVPVETLPRPPPNPNPSPVAAAAAAGVEEDDDWILGGSDPIPGVDPTGDWADEDDDEGDPAPPVKLPAADNDLDPLMGGGAEDSGPAIPGLSSSAAAGAAGSDQWDSDSEDDIQIVLNETDGRRGLGDDEGDDEDGEDLVIVADGPHITGIDEQDWGEDPVAAGAEGERKDGGEPGKTAAAPGGRIGYSGGGQGFHQQHHSMFKVSYLGQEAVRCTLATPTEGDVVNPVLSFSCTVLLCGNFLSSLVSFYNLVRTIPDVTVNALLTWSIKEERKK